LVNKLLCEHWSEERRGEEREKRGEGERRKERAKKYLLVPILKIARIVFNSSVFISSVVPAANTRKKIF
jgi:hypothetical protein